jgi:hypothetical protein
MLTKITCWIYKLQRKILGYLRTCFVMWSPKMYVFYYAYAWGVNSEFLLTSEVMPVTMKNMEATNNWESSLICKLAGFQSPQYWQYCGIFTWTLHMELTKYDWPAIKYLKSQDVKSSEIYERMVVHMRFDVVTIVLLQISSLLAFNTIIQWVVSNALMDHNVLIFRPKQPKQAPNLHLHGSSSGQQMYG